MNKHRYFFIMLSSFALALILVLSDMLLPTTSISASLTQSCVPDSPGESNNIVDALTVCDGQIVSGQVDDSDWDDVYKILLVASQTITITMNGTGVGGPGDADLYLYPPGTTDVYTDPFAALSENGGNSEFIQYTVSQAGFWYIDVYDYTDGDGGTNYSLTITVSEEGATVYLPIVIKPSTGSPITCTPSPPGESNNISDALTICSGQVVSGQVDDSDWDDVYKIFGPAGRTLTISMNGTGVGGPGDADLYLYPPGTTDVNTDPFAALSDNGGNSEFIHYTISQAGFWYIDVFDYTDGDGGTNYSLTAALSSSSSTEIKVFETTGTSQLRQRGSNKPQE